MFGIAPLEAAPECPCFEYIGMQIAAIISDRQKGLPNCDEGDEEKRDGPARLDAVHPAQNWLSPTRRRILRSPNLGERRHKPVACEAVRQIASSACTARPGVHNTRALADSAYLLSLKNVHVPNRKS